MGCRGQKPNARLASSSHASQPLILHLSLYSPSPGQSPLPPAAPGPGGQAGLNTLYTEEGAHDCGPGGLLGPGGKASPS